TFVADQIDHDARWTFDPKKQALSPINSEAVSLSQQGELPQNLVPRLRAVALTDDAESSRFDSGAFTVGADGGETGPLLEPVIHGRIGAQDPGPLPSDEAPPHKPTNQTADLLEALRRRRGERDPMDPEHDEPIAAHPSTGAVKLIDVPLDTATVTPVGSAGTPSAGSTGTGQQSGISRGSRKNRTSMPSWDEIVFGARTDED
ncbi:MAG: septation protein SepH, partial [Pseudolysinimonas sp.]